MFYDLIERLVRPAAWWGRLRVDGLEHVPEAGPLLVVPNHDSQWDPLILGVAIRPRRRVRFLAQAELWRIPGLGVIMDGLQQIPIKRGAGDGAALERAVEALKAGDAIGVFPEGRLSWGESIRARSGVGLLANWVPDARIVLCAIRGTTDYVRFPKRPRVTLRFFPPAEGERCAGEEPAALAARLLADVRAHVPPAPAGRRGVVGVPARVQRDYDRQRSRTT